MPDDEYDLKKREYIAAHVLSSIAAMNNFEGDHTTKDIKDGVKIAIKYADELLKQLEESK